MESTHHASAENAAGFWSIFARVLGIGLAGFSLVAATAFIIRGLQYSRMHGPQAAPAQGAAVPATGAVMPAGVATAAPASSTTVDARSGQVTLKPGTDNPLTYDVKSFIVNAGQKLKVTFNNQSVLPQPHNFILGKMGSKDRLIAAVGTMVTDPNGFAKSFIPESPDIIVSMKLVNPGQSETLDITVPAEKGEYPYLCSFPGHAMLMNGVMKVE